MIWTPVARSWVRCARGEKVVRHEEVGRPLRAASSTRASSSACRPIRFAVLAALVRSVRENAVLPLLHVSSSESGLALQ